MTKKVKAPRPVDSPQRRYNTQFYGKPKREQAPTLSWWLVPKEEFAAAAEKRAVELRGLDSVKLPGIMPGEWPIPGSKRSIKASR